MLVVHTVAACVVYLLYIPAAAAAAAAQFVEGIARDCGYCRLSCTFERTVCVIKFV